MKRLDLILESKAPEKTEDVRVFSVCHIVEQLGKDLSSQSAISTSKYSSIFGNYHHSLVSLQVPLDSGRLKAQQEGVELLESQDFFIIKEKISKADIVHLHYQESSLMNKLLEQDLSACRLLIWFYPSIASGVLAKCDAYQIVVNDSSGFKLSRDFFTNDAIKYSDSISQENFKIGESAPLENPYLDGTKDSAQMINSIYSKLLRSPKEEYLNSLNGNGSLLEEPITMEQVLGDTKFSRAPSSPAPQYLKKTEPPRISIITPSYNQGQYLEACMDSILSQNYPNLEYIVMDGGSNDNSVAIIKKYEKHLSYWQSQKDEGHYPAVNAGFQRTSGDIQAWLNSDDMYQPDAFQTVAHIYRYFPQIEWLTGRPAVLGEDGQLKWVYLMLPKYCREFYLDKRYMDPWIQQESTFWKRSLWEKAGGYLDSRYNFAADLELWTRFFRHAQLYTVNQVLSGIRLHFDSKTGLFLQRYIVEAKEILDREKELYERGVYTNLDPTPKPVLSLDPQENDELTEFCMGDN